MDPFGFYRFVCLIVLLENKKAEREAQKAAEDAQTAVKEEKATFASKLSGLFKK